MRIAFFLHNQTLVDIGDCYKSVQPVASGTQEQGYWEITKTSAKVCCASFSRLQNSPWNRPLRWMWPSSRDVILLPVEIARFPVPARVGSGVRRLGRRSRGWWRRARPTTRRTWSSSTPATRRNRLRRRMSWPATDGPRSRRRAAAAVELEVAAEVAGRETAAWIQDAGRRQRRPSHSHHETPETSVSVISTVSLLSAVCNSLILQSRHIELAKPSIQPRLSWIDKLIQETH